MGVPEHEGGLDRGAPGPAHIGDITRVVGQHIDGLPGRAGHGAARRRGAGPGVEVRLTPDDLVFTQRRFVLVCRRPCVSNAATP